jgi:hypothetical protein
MEGSMRYIGCLLTVILALSVSAADGAAVIPAGSPSDPALQTDLWISHLKNFAAAHPELTNEQRGVVSEGSELLAEGLLRHLRSTAAGEVADARKALEAFKTRASELFSRELYAEAFVRLERPAVPLKPGVPGSATPRIPDCDCNPTSGACGECVTGSCRVMPDGCGTMGTDLCYGLCW